MMNKTRRCLIRICHGNTYRSAWHFSISGPTAMPSTERAFLQIDNRCSVLQTIGGRPASASDIFFHPRAVVSELTALTNLASEHVHFAGLHVGQYIQRSPHVHAAGPQCESAASATTADPVCRLLAGFLLILTDPSHPTNLRMRAYAPEVERSLRQCPTDADLLNRYSTCVSVQNSTHFLELEHRHSCKIA
jgi:hypothetical protein